MSDFYEDPHFSDQEVKADLVEVPCAYGCNMPVEVVDVRVHHSSDPGGHTIVVNYRCLGGHRWPDAGLADPVLNEEGWV